MKGRLQLYLVYTIFLIFCVLLGSGIGLIAGALKTAPRLSDVHFDPKTTTVLYDTNGQIIARLYTENRTPVTLDQIPQTLQDAVIAIEDDRFYEHHGVDPKAILRAIIVDILRGEKAQGGSTITQQLARNAFLSQEKTFTRKIKEIIWAIQIERKYTKDEILETYLNEIYFGHGAYGVEAASQLYFGKSVSDLTLSESALLAGIIQIPGRYSPYLNMKAAIQRRNVVLHRMMELGYITPAQEKAAQQEPVKLVGLKPSQNKAPYFVDYVTQYLLNRYGQAKVYGGGLKVYTSLDLNVQEAAEKALLENLPEGNKDANGLTQPQGALVAIDPQTGYIRAMVGGRGEDKFNRAVMAYRQPGSAIKPFLYTAAIDRGYTPATIIEDAPVEYQLPDGKVWAPKNNDNIFRGPVTLRTALEDSINVVAVKLLDQVGVGTMMHYAKMMGITDLVERGEPNDRHLGLALGGIVKGVTPLEMAMAYAVLANGGIKLDRPIAVVRVEDKNGRVLEENQAKKQIVLSEQTAYIITDMLRGVIERGTGRAANIGRPAAGKTGTSSEYTNGWFIGYTPDLVAAVWIGNDDQKEPMSYGGVNYGSWKAAQIWGLFMQQALANTPIRDFPRPENIVTVNIDPASGLLATDQCENVRTEVFIKGTEPKEYCPLHQNWWQRLFQGGQGSSNPPTPAPKPGGENQSEGGNQGGKVVVPGQSSPEGPKNTPGPVPLPLAQ